MNIFEGSRRILKFIQVIWVLFAISIGWTSDPVVYEYYILMPNTPPRIANIDDTCSKSDRDIVVWRSKYLIDIRYSLCAKYLEDQDISEQDKIKIISDIKNDFDNHKFYNEKVESEVLNKIREKILLIIKISFAGIASIYLIGFFIGWIIRGFLGIPFGKDSRE